MRDIAILIVILFVVAMVLALETACSPAPPLTAETEQTISQDHQASAIAAAKASDAGAVALAAEKAKSALSLANGADAPLLHPVSALNLVVVTVRPWLIAATVITSLLWAVQFALSFTSFSFLSSFAPVFRWLAILCLAALLSLPFLPIGFLVVLLAALGLLVYELVKDKFNLKQSISDAESLLGFTPPTPTTPTPTPSAPAAAPAMTIAPAPAVAKAA